MEVKDIEGNVKHEFGRVVITIGDNKYRISESYGKLNINKSYMGNDFNAPDIEAIAAFPRSSNEIEIK